MVDFYASMAKVASDLLAPTSQNGLGQGTITLTRVTGGTAGANPWDPVTPTTSTEVLRGAVSGISKELIGTEAGGTVLLASDRMAICAVPVNGYGPGDVLSVDGVPVTVLSVQNIPAAGIAAAVRFVIRG